jgi:hypothetical protein
MANIILLGDDGKAGGNILQQLGVPEENVFTVDNTADLARNIKKQVGAIHVVNWIGHGTADRLLVPGGDFGPKKAATFFDILQPMEKIILWACNTGLCSAGQELRKLLWKAYKGSEEYTKTDAFRYTKKEVKEVKKDPVTGNVVKTMVQKKVETEEYKKYQKFPAFRDKFGQMKLVLGQDQVEGQVTQSVVYRIAEQMTNLNGSSVYGPIKGIQPGAIRTFDMKEGPGNMVQWESRCGGEPKTMCNTFKWGYIAVIDDKTYKLICKMEEDAIQKQYSFTFNAPYVDL